MSDNRSPLATLKSIGPAIIVAAVVLGPGSIIVSSRVGAVFGYSAAWVLALAVILLIAMVRLAAHVGLAYEKSPCQEIADRIGKKTAIALGVVVFLIIACFQTSNNIAVAAAIEPLFDHARARFGMEADAYSIYGHSAGAQFVHRFLFHVPDARVARAVAANAERDLTTQAAVTAL